MSDSKSEAQANSELEQLWQDQHLARLESAKKARFGLIVATIFSLSIIVLGMIIASAVISSAEKQLSSADKRLGESEKLLKDSRVTLTEIRGEIKVAEAKLEELEIKLARARSDLAASSRTSEVFANKLAEVGVNPSFILEEKAAGRPARLCYIKYHDDRASRDLAQKAAKVLSRGGWLAPVYVADYEGPKKRQKFLAQVRYASKEMESYAKEVVKLLGREEISAFIQFVPEPDEQKNHLRLWILHD